MVVNHSVRPIADAARIPLVVVLTVQMFDDNRESRGSDTTTTGSAAQATQAGIPRSRWGGRQRQVSCTVADPPEPVVSLRFGSDSQMIEPSGFFLMYLYWNEVFAGRLTPADQTG